MQLERASGSRRRAISMTALIDVVFILLLFFMITTQFRQHQAITLNVSDSGASTPAPALARLSIAVQHNGLISIGEGQLIKHSALADQPQIAKALAKGTPVHVMPDDEVTLQTLTRLMDTLAGLGLADITLARKP